MEKKVKRGPLLYIAQPFTVTPAVKMQDVYTNRQDEQLNTLDLPLEEEVKKKKKFFEVSLEKTEIPLEKSEVDVKQQPMKGPEKTRSFNKVKKFKEMNVNERLEYLLNFPKALPPVPCVFITEESNYQGYLQDYNDQFVTIKLPNQSTETIPFNEIKDVAMLGIKR